MTISAGPKAIPNVGNVPILRGLVQLRHSDSLQELHLIKFPNLIFPQICEPVAGLSRLSLLHMTMDRYNTVLRDTTILPSQMLTETPPPSLKTVIIDNVPHSFPQYVEWILRPQRNFVLENVILTVSSMANYSMFTTLAAVLKSVRTFYLDHHGGSALNAKLQDLLNVLPSCSNLRTLCLPLAAFDPETQQASLPPSLEEIYIVLRSDSESPDQAIFFWYDPGIRRVLETSRLRRLRRIIFVVSTEDGCQQFVSSRDLWISKIMEYVKTTGGIKV